MARGISKVRGEVGVRIWTKATIYVANEVMRVFITLLDQRRLNNYKLLQQKEVITNGLFTWITTRHLKTAVLEIYHQNDTNKAIERWDLVFMYEEPTDDDGFYEDKTEKLFETYLDEVSEFMRELAALPEGTEYRIVVDLDEGALAVEGWQPTIFKDISHLQQHHFGDDVIRTGLIDLGMEYWGRI